MSDGLSGRVETQICRMRKPDVREVFREILLTRTLLLSMVNWLGIRIPCEVVLLLEFPLLRTVDR